RDAVRSRLGRQSHEPAVEWCGARGLPGKEMTVPRSDPLGNPTGIRRSLPRRAGHITCSVSARARLAFEEGRVAQTSRTIAATVVGAVLGGIAGYLFFTDEG